jgi:hypothetical protein
MNARWLRRRCRWCTRGLYLPVVWPGIKYESPPGSKVRVLLPVWIKSRCSFVKVYATNPDHNRWKSTYIVLGTYIPWTTIPVTPVAVTVPLIKQITTYNICIYIHMCSIIGTCTTLSDKRHAWFIVSAHSWWERSIFGLATYHLCNWSSTRLWLYCDVLNKSTSISLVTTY